jgi:arginine/lysine/ornithine decarboxylase
MLRSTATSDVNPIARALKVTQSLQHHDSTATAMMRVIIHTHRSTSAQHSLAAARSYEAHKMEDRQTAQLCAAAGLTLVPMIAETLGGWGPAAQHFFRRLSRATAERQGLDPSIASSQLYESMGIKLQRANARAVLSRTSALLSSCDNTAIATTRSEAALVLSAAVPLTS